ncbi:indigoidine synthase A-like protein [Neolentinus lepideus HHB14362 ss-1]|uniref:Indigoidine synthase A-like protein n=1 Tax=Neolentinus lepideus HHB14362 ss-1 TaxID=1314782 RepID=A0A165W331_9AGAM|nr:indigoidine synthase A-like protein [Neolentinus lepideus HHB14362 ss-1]
MRPLPRLLRSFSHVARLPPFVDVVAEVQHALHTGAPVVALESTIITHGMPYPTNLATALSVEGIVRAHGAVPATIAIVQGRVKVGMEKPLLERLVHNSGEGSVVKVSRRDIGPVLALGKDGGTTCSATLIFSALAGIKVFATGGLGGVHRGGENSLDISADLHELTRCPVGLVSAGIKSILDIGRTLEYLETLGVPVLTYGESNDFPAFYSPASGFQSPYSINDPISAARVLHAQSLLSMPTGALFAAPIPSAYHAAASKIQEAVEAAVRESEENGMSRRGKEVTPWLLKRVGELTRGESLASNVALIENTAKIGAQIAVAYSDLVREQGHGLESSGTSTFQPAVPSQPEASALTPSALLSPSPTVNTPPPPPPQADLAILGASAIDISAHPHPSADLQAHSTSPGSIALSLGGVARNVAEAAFRLSSPPPASPVALVSPVGQDAFGRVLLDELARIGMRTDGLVRAGRTAVCNMVMDAKGGLVGGVADMGGVETLQGEEALEALQKLAPRIVALDANLRPDTISAVVRWCREHGIKTFFEPTSVTKSTAILSAIASSLTSSSSTPHDSPVTFASPNLLELKHLYQTARSDTYDLTAHPAWWHTVDAFSLGAEFRMDLEHLARREPALGFLVDSGVAQMAVNLLPFFRHLIVKCGEVGVVVAMRTNAAASPAWAGERSNVHARCVVAHGKTGAGEIVVLKHLPAANVDPGTIVNVTGAGDSLVGSILASLVRNQSAFEDPKTMNEVIDLAQQSAVMTLQSANAVSPLLSNLL